MSHLETMRQRMLLLQAKRARGTAPSANVPRFNFVGRMLLRPAEAAEACGVSVKTFKSWGIRSFKLENVIGYRPRDIEAFIEQRMEPVRANRTDEP